MEESSQERNPDPLFNFSEEDRRLLKKIEDSERVATARAGSMVEREIQSEVTFLKEEQIRLKEILAYLSKFIESHPNEVYQDMPLAEFAEYIKNADFNTHIRDQIEQFMIDYDTEINDKLNPIYYLWEFLDLVRKKWDNATFLLNPGPEIDDKKGEI